MSREVIAVEGVPAAPGFSQVVRAGDLLVVSGQVARDDTGALVGRGDAGGQAAQIFANLERALAAGGATPDDVVKLTVYLTDRSQRAAVSAERDRAFAEPRPASTLVVVAGLAHPDLLVEVEALAYLGHGQAP